MASSEVPAAQLLQPQRSGSVKRPAAASRAMPLWLKAAAGMVFSALKTIGYQSVLVGVATLFAIALHTMGGLAMLSRLFYTPASIKHLAEVKARSPCAAAERRLRAQQAAARGETEPDAKDEGKERPTVTVRAIASEAFSVAPVHLYNQPELGINSEAWKHVSPYVKLYGRNAIANSQLFNPEFVHFFVPGMGSLPYVVADIYGRAIVSAIGDPLCHESKWRVITELFVKEYPRTIFYHASAKYAQLLSDMGYYINDVGAETTLQVQSWTYSGRTRTVRAAARAARESGVRVRELKPEELTEEMRRKLEHDISSDWLQQKAVAERQLRVFVRNVDYERMQLRDGVRIFVAEAWHPALAPPAVVDPVLQGAALNAKPPKPPRKKSSASLAGGGASSSNLSRSASVLTAASSAVSLASLGSAPSHSATPAPPGAPGSSTPVPPGAGVMPAGAAACATPFGAGEAAAAAASDAAGDAAADAAALEAAREAGPELTGFVLLDPLWEGGEQVGYVSSIVRMKRTGHSGTLKLLYEDIISKLRQEGRKELAFGFAPFFNIQDDKFTNIVYWIRWTSLYFYYYANNLYAFQNLAFSKIRYGAGVDGDKFRDPNVTMSHIYMASSDFWPNINILDLYVLCMYVGFMDTMFDTYLKMLGVTKGGASLTPGAQQD